MGIDLLFASLSGVAFFVAAYRSENHFQLDSVGLENLVHRAGAGQFAVDRPDAGSFCARARSGCVPDVCDPSLDL
jgi:hypothetical protein